MNQVEVSISNGPRNGSAAMFQRRRHILEVARRMIASGGLENFNMRELCDRAGIAQRTIYYAFGCKENVIASAIKQHFDSFRRRVSGGKAIENFDDALQHHVTTILWNLETPHFVHAIAALYYSPTIHASIRQVLILGGEHSYLNWLQNLSLSRQTEPGQDISRVATDISNLRYALIHEWGIGSLTGEQFMYQSLETVLLHLCGALRGAARQEVKAALADWRKQGAKSQRLLEIAAGQMDLFRQSSDGADLTAPKEVETQASKQIAGERKPSADPRRARG